MIPVLIVQGVREEWGSIRRELQLHKLLLGMDYALFDREDDAEEYIHPKFYADQLLCLGETERRKKKGDDFSLAIAKKFPGIKIVSLFVPVPPGPSPYSMYVRRGAPSNICDLLVHTMMEFLVRTI